MDRVEQVAEIGVCLADSQFYPLYSGGAMRFQRYALGLVSRSVRMRVFTLAVTDDLIALQGTFDRREEIHGDAEGNSLSDWPLTEIIDGILIQRTMLPGGWLRWPTYYARLVSYCVRRRGEIKVVQFLLLHHWAIPWIHLLRRCGFGTVFTCTMMGQLSVNPLKRTVQRWYRRILFNTFDSIVVSSSLMKQYVESLGVHRPIWVIPHGVNLQRFRPIQQTLEKICIRRKLGLNPDSNIILAVGSIEFRKGTDILVQAFLRLCHNFPDAHLVIVGHGQINSREGSGLQHHLENMIASANAENRVTFAGLVKNVEDYLRVADVFVLPSRREGMPNAMLEAMACGIPVVATPFLGLSEEFGVPGVHYVLSGSSPSRLAADIGTVLAEEQGRMNLGQLGRIWVEQHLDVNHSLDLYASLYKELAGRSKKTALGLR